MTLAERAAGGAARGVAATGAMSLVLAARWLAQRDVPPPPLVVAENTQRKLGLEPVGRRGLRHPTWLAAHTGFGATLGAVHALVAPRRGVGYGLAAWTVNYGVALPALGIYPRVDRDVRMRAVASLASHAVFGWTLGRLRR